MITASKWFWNGLWNYTSRGFEKKKQHFNENDLNQDISSKHFIITGGNNGLGFQTSLELAKLGGNVHILCRNQEKGEVAINEIKDKSGSNKVHFHLCDVSMVSSIKSFVEDWKKQDNPRIDVLIHNAGVMLPNREETSEGHEKTFATNLLGPFLLTKLLMCTDGEKAGNVGFDQAFKRVIFISSGGMLTSKMTTDFEFKRFLTNPKLKWDGMKAYAETKRSLVYLTELFSEKYPSFNSYSMHPGWVDTTGVMNGMPLFYKMTKSQLRTLKQGCDTIVWLAVSPTINDHSKFSGEFYEDRQIVNKYIHNSNTESSQEDINTLWNYLNDIYSKNFQ
ncbi:hypothetical protein RB653_008598 [Dictyostelium firmibasis]|uniref:Dehydrogenase/reductase SDR family member 12 n=1 Tax=Dictyostelium firmibasis TaxID=79012 RepID=A0AAN7U0T2_9MYCE